MGILGIGRKRARSSNGEADLAKEPCCGVCGLTAKGVERRTKRKEPSALIVGNLVGICPTCKHAYCNQHALTQEELECCPMCRSQLDFTWDQGVLEEAQVHIGAPVPTEG